jgi:hypothetical protein
LLEAQNMYVFGIHILLVALWVGVATSALFSLWKGDRAVRLGALINLALNVTAIPPFRHAIAGDAGEVAGILVDLMASICFLVLAVRFANLWIGTVMIVQAGEFSLHSYYLLMERPRDSVHAWLNNIGEWIIVACIVAGTIGAIRRRQATAREEAELQALREQRAAAHA